ncbi:glycoside hydrolase family 6 protein [Streptomyces ureilyticus]|uniref:Glucanase n=1 Tax=Streptomyces ureilyticus TaxID=1775131 RepID=A0ABX0E3H6_9ACTN|nr:glycoside hydrolase family 6 protein [Streptomyces ureilyticus]NGO47804.1 glycoside hydrolase family 6 protein [Streptomyces ureilyticus]
MYERRGAGARASVAVAGVVLLLAGCSSSGDDGDGEKDPAGQVSQQPKGDDPYWVNPDGNAAQQMSTFTEEGKKEEAELIKKIAAHPTGEWVTPEKAEDEARGFTEAAEKADRDALLVLYNIPHRDCGQFSQGGAKDGDAYREFIDQVAGGIGDRNATVILEPDALLHVVDGCTAEEFHQERLDLLKGAVEKLGSLKNTKVYLDAGNAGNNASDLYDPLKKAGIDQADGFSVNVSNFYTTEDSTKFGKELSAKIGNKPFVIDTSRNGNGPFTEGKDPWCNPPGRALGEEPTTKTGDDLVDAYLWVKRPGESDGTCRGGPNAGEWWPEYALELAKASQ